MMNKELDPKNQEKIKALLKGLEEVKLSESGMNTFLSKLDEIPKRGKRSRLAELKERLSFTPEDIIGRIIEDIFARPVPTLARVAAVLIIGIILYLSLIHI